MHTILKHLSALFEAFLARDCPPDPLAALTTRDWADLPPTHPRADGEGRCAC